MTKLPSLRHRRRAGAAATAADLPTRHRPGASDTPDAQRTPPILGSSGAPDALLGAPLAPSARRGVHPIPERFTTMPSTTLLPGICRSCGGPIPRTGTGRHPATCSPICRRAHRAAAARARRRAAAPATPEPSEAEQHAAADALKAAADRTRQRLRDLNSERAARHIELEDGIANLADFYPSDGAPAGGLGGLGLSRVGPRRDSHGRETVWASDGSRAAAVRRSAKAAEAIRAACLDEALRATRISARARGVFVLEDDDIRAAEAVAEARAAAILAAL